MLPTFVFQKKEFLSVENFNNKTKILSNTKILTFIKKKFMATLFVKNMVCNRCILVVENELQAMGIEDAKVSLGEIILNQELNSTQLSNFTTKLEALGFELIDNQKSRTIEQIKNLIIQQIHHQKEPLQLNLSDWLSQELQQDYNSLSHLFSEIEGTTIEKYYIAQRIEKVKELLVYDELTLSEIADQLNYSSVSYLSNQFKKITGLTPSHFKQIGKNKRTPLDQV